MVRTRPTVILVMAILSIIFGSFSLLLSLCGGAMPLILYHVPMPRPGGGTQYPFREFYDLLQRQVPAFIPIEASNVGLGAALAILLILSGIGLLRMRSWAWWTSVIYSLVAVVRAIAYFLFTLLIINPIAEKWTEDLLRQQPQGAPNFSSNSVINAIIGGAPLLGSIAFAAALLVIMFLPSVRAALAGPVKTEESSHAAEAADEGP